jgi:hypothetical protein
VNAQRPGTRPGPAGDAASVPLWDDHRALLEARAIKPGVARARGYESTAGGGLLAGEGFGQAVCGLGPGLVIPVHDVHGERRYAQFRPDKPRLGDKNRPVKYETPPRIRPVLDVPPQVRGKLDDPSRPLWVAEGPMKADAAVSAGLTCIAMTGVYGWRGTNRKGGKTALACWEDVALAGRTVYLVPDSDVAVNPMVATAITRLGAWLASRDADVRYVFLPHAADGGKRGLDDFLAHGGTVDGLLELADEDPPARPAAAPAPSSQPPVPVPADPAALLDGVHRLLRSYVAFPSGHAALAVTLWAAHTHMAAAFDSTPRLALLSPEKRCGKSRALELLGLLCAGAEALSDASPAYVFRRIGAGPVTLLLDEADAIWRRGKTDERAEALRSIVNAGHRRGASVGRVEMNGQAAKLVQFPVYAPAALAAIGTLPDTILDRAVVVRMRRRAPDQPVRKYRERVTRPEGEELRGQLAAWAAAASERVGDPWPDLPAGLNDRAEDAWEPLLAIADQAGGDWPQLARAACAALADGAAEDTQTTGTRLLADLRAIFGDADALVTKAILGKLHALDESPWGDWYGHPLTARDLAELLRPFEVKPRRVRVDGATPGARGYTRADLYDAWRRYLAGVSATDATSATWLASHVADVADVADTQTGEQQ